ncbi:MAG: hypothetical protein EBR81_13295 [Proteobacteria bacterium]|nr:hypothetical protein [Pseudomonadota bacterium]
MNKFQMRVANCVARAKSKAVRPELSQEDREKLLAKMLEKAKARVAFLEHKINGRGEYRKRR